MRLTAKERILLHLLEYADHRDDPRVPPELTRQGIARASWIDVRHVPQNVRPLIREGLVSERTSHVAGGTRRQKTYSLTDSGRREAIRLRAWVKAETVQVRDASGVHESTFEQVLQEAGRTRSLLEIARQAIETGTVDLSTRRSILGTETELMLPNASQLEADFDWSGAADVYKRALASTAAGDFLRLGSLYERLGYALHRAAMQATQPIEFRERMREALDDCERARDAYETSADPGTRARILRCSATAAYLRFWLAATIDERRRELKEAWGSTSAALRVLDEEGNEREYGATANRLSLVPVLGFFTEWDKESQEPALVDAIELGERAIRALSTSGDAKELARAYASTAGNLGLLAARPGDPDLREEHSRRATEYWQRARELSEEAAILQPFPARSFWGPGSDEAVATTRTALEFARRTKDRFVVGWMLRQLAYHKVWKSYAIENLDEWKETLRSGLEDAENAKREFASIAFGDIIGGSFSVVTAHAEYYDELARRELEPHAREDLLKKGVEAAREDLKLAENLGFLDPIGTAHWACARVLLDKVRAETNVEVKRRLLEEALGHVDEFIKIEERGLPSLVFNQGEGRIQRALAKSELAELTESQDVKTRLLQEAVPEAEEGLNLCIQDTGPSERRGDINQFVEIGIYQSKCVDLYTRLCELIGDRGYARKAAEMLEHAAESFRKPGLPSRIAECYWKAGQVHDSLEDHLEAAEEFALASNTYKAALEKVPQLKDFYQDLALYMQGWSEIERARHHHGREEYGQAKDCYERAKTLHSFSKKWGFMAPNYAAWAQVESAEDLSRAERGTEAIGAFRQAGGLFREAKASLEAALKGVQDLDERRMVGALVKAAARRSQYCAARIAIEEAKLLNKNGEHASSSQRYGQAADEFEKLAAAAESDRDRRDLSLIATLAKAWEAMTKAEADDSPELYAEAARFFEAARELGSGEKTKALASGHSRFCDALEAGTKFADSRDPAFYASAIRHLDSAASHYARAGAVSASEYSQASKLLFDAYAAMDRAGQEVDQERKAKAYLAVEKILEASAAAFERAGLPGKRDQALRLLEGVKRERELAVSLTELVRAPLIVSSTAAFATPAPSYERAVGIERLEHADIRASLIPTARTLALGEDLKLELELVNAGRAPGLLIKVEELVPQGFEVVARPDKCEMEGNAVALKGRRLEPLKTELVSLVLKPLTEGAFKLKPRVMYLDESGNYKSHEPEQVDVNVVGSA